MKEYAQQEPFLQILLEMSCTFDIKTKHVYEPKSLPETIFNFYLKIL